MISLVSIVICFWDALVAGALYGIAVYFDIPPKHAITKTGFYLTIGIALIYSTVCAIVAYIGPRLANHSDKQKTLYMYVCMAIYVIGNALIILMFGALSMASGILLAGAPIVGWILFDKHGVFYATVIGTVIVMAGFWLAFFGVIPFVLMIDESHGIYSNLSYNAAMFCAVFPHTISLLYLAHQAIFQWKSREAHVNHLAHTDSLTKVANRRQIDQLLLNAIAENESWVSVLMFDVDHFKVINDNFGHGAGDEILNQVIVAIKSAVRQKDEIGRFGGDEFMVVLPNTNKQTASEVAQRCLDAVRITAIKYQNNALTVTVSIGLQTATFSKDDVEIIADTLINDADAALYRAKSLGRNRLVVA